MRIAAYNVENLFSRAVAMNVEGWSAGRAALEAHAALNALFAKPSYSAADRAAMLRHLETLGLLKSDDGPLARLRRNQGPLLRRPRQGPVEIIAEGRDDWEGWIELEREPVDSIARRLTARVIDDVGADVIGLVEAESRPSLAAFNALLGTPYVHVMLIDGNDARGIDVALMCRAAHPILGMRSHVDLRDATGPVFSRDCPAYQVAAPGGTITVLVNHLKSKGFGRPTDSNRKRQRQAEAIAGIYRDLQAQGQDRVVVLGDMNDTPDSAPLAPLLAGTDLRDIGVLPGHENGGLIGTYGASGPGNKIDYILLSPALAGRVRASGVLRAGMWPGKRRPKWTAYPEMLTEANAASDHAALWVDLDL
ncbi:MAG: endonuclease/exonuclease/phosphatase family protein [Alphaproteobacteria bacterium]|nr:endonuclease/exonuclease/phosphatase family protein [Alphaproteobacteria bacterium]